jgi:DNA replication protein DnaC
MLADLCTTLSSLKLRAMAERLTLWMDDPSNRGRSHIDFIEALVQAQEQAVAYERSRRFLQRSGLPSSVSLTDIWTGHARGLTAQVLSNLATCDWVRLGHVVVVTGPTRVGKTCLVSALGHQAATEHGLTVSHQRGPECLRQCAREQAQGTWDRYLKRVSATDLLVLDDFALERASIEETCQLYELMDARERKGKATLVASPNHVDDWDDYFDGASGRAALLGRVLGRSQVIELKLGSRPRSAASKPQSKSRSGKVEPAF